LENAIASAKRDRRQVAVILLDMDNFKQINDTLGHPVGDALLIDIAKRLGEHVRASDVICRLGGDEFLILLPDIDNAVAVGAIASKLQRCLAQAYLFEGYSLGLKSGTGPLCDVLRHAQHAAVALGDCAQA
jgi:diguanylate cyclase (GGDEF)-like protein